jgi:hypothetical protein
VPVAALTPVSSFSRSFVPNGRSLTKPRSGAARRSFCGTVLHVPHHILWVSRCLTFSSWKSVMSWF